MRYPWQEKGGTRDHLDGGPQLSRAAQEPMERLQINPAILPTDRILRSADIERLIGGRPSSQFRGDSRRRVVIYGAGDGGLTLLEAIY